MSQGLHHISMFQHHSTVLLDMPTPTLAATLLVAFVSPYHFLISVRPPCQLSNPCPLPFTVTFRCGSCPLAYLFLFLGMPHRGVPVTSGYSSDGLSARLLHPKKPLVPNTDVTAIDENKRVDKGRVSTIEESKCQRHKSDCYCLVGTTGFNRVVRGIGCTVPDWYSI